MSTTCSPSALPYSQSMWPGRAVTQSCDWLSSRPAPRQSRTGLPPSLAVMTEWWDGPPPSPATTDAPRVFCARRCGRQGECMRETNESQVWQCLREATELWSSSGLFAMQTSEGKKVRTRHTHASHFSCPFCLSVSSCIFLHAQLTDGRASGWVGRLHTALQLYGELKTSRGRTVRTYGDTHSSRQTTPARPHSCCLSVRLDPKPTVMVGMPLL